jgi:accessory colonization factor AcfC
VALASALQCLSCVIPSHRRAVKTRLRTIKPIERSIRHLAASSQTALDAFHCQHDAQAMIHPVTMNLSCANQGVAHRAENEAQNKASANHATTVDNLELPLYKCV